jgi:hypothetical protein
VKTDETPLRTINITNKLQFFLKTKVTEGHNLKVDGIQNQISTVVPSPQAGGAHVRPQHSGGPGSNLGGS